MDLTTHLTKMLLRADASHSELAGAGHVLQALACRRPNNILRHLTAAQKRGVDLRAVGTLALNANKRAVAGVLRDTFGVMVVDYVINGEATGRTSLSSSDTCPYLVVLAHQGDTSVQERALAWGADPNATWTMDKIVGRSDLPKQPVVVGWADENIRALNVPMAQRLMALTSPTPDDEHRRLAALTEAGLGGGSTAEGRLKRLVGMLEPGGAHALTISPWEHPYADTNLAVHRSALSASQNTALESGRIFQMFDGWIDRTRPATDEAVSEVLSYSVLSAEHNPQSSRFNDPNLPMWCVDRAPPELAQSLLARLWTIKMHNIEVGPMGMGLSFRPPNHALVRLAERAQQAPNTTPFTGPHFLVAQLGFATLQGLRPDDLFTILTHCPIVSDPAAPSQATDDVGWALRKLQDFNDEKRRSNMTGAIGPSMDQRKVLLDELKIAHDRCILEAACSPVQAQRPPLKM